MRAFAYKVPLPSRSVGPVLASVRLLFRNLPPYMLRELDAHQEARDSVRLGTLVKNLQIVEMASARATLDLHGR